MNQDSETFLLYFEAVGRYDALEIPLRTLIPLIADKIKEWENLLVILASLSAFNLKIRGIDKFTNPIIKELRRYTIK